ncbi:MAG: exosortase B [Betaproteobacteria bacterium]|nr:exosortase B [Betaproteobacteria bacterium]
MPPVLEQWILPVQDGEGLRRWLPVALGLAVMYVPTYLDLAQGLWREEPYAHGPIILAVVAWLTWRQRAAMAAADAGGAPLAGSVALTLGVALYVIGRSQSLPLFEVGSQIPVFAGAVLLLLGWRALARLWFPLVFLSFLVPLPGFVIYGITGPLKTLVSQNVESVLYLLGYPVARAGVMLSIGQYQLLVTDACSGLNSLYSLAALGFLYLHLTASGNIARAVCLAAGILPIALAANGVRVLILVLVTFHLGDEAGQSFLHGFAGMTLFMTALLLLLGLDALLRRLPALNRPGAPA